MFSLRQRELFLTPDATRSIKNTRPVLYDMLQNAIIQLIYLTYSTHPSIYITIITCKNYVAIFSLPILQSVIILHSPLLYPLSGLGRCAPLIGLFVFIVDFKFIEIVSSSSAKVCRGPSKYSRVLLLRSIRVPISSLRVFTDRRWFSVL